MALGFRGDENAAVLTEGPGGLCQPRWFCACSPVIGVELDQGDGRKCSGPLLGIDMTVKYSEI